MEANDTCEMEEPNADAFRLVLIVGIGTTVCIIGIILNSFLLLSLKQLHFLRTNQLYLFLLAAFDILVEICFMLIFPVSLVWDYYRVESLYIYWHYYIKYVSTIGQVLIAGSTLLIVAASFERYICSLKSSMQFSDKNRGCVIAVVIICSLIMKGSVFFELELHQLKDCPAFANLRLDLSSITRSETYKTIWMFWCRSIFNVFTPFALLLLLNGATLANLSKSNHGFQNILLERYPRTRAMRNCMTVQSIESIPTTSTTLGSISEMSQLCTNTKSQMPTLLCRNSDALIARRRKRDATRTLAALVTIYLFTNTLNLLLTIMEFIEPEILRSLGEGWTYKYLADLSSVLTISSTAFRLPVYFHCNGDIRTQLRQFAKSCFLPSNDEKKPKSKKLSIPMLKDCSPESSI